MNIRVKKKSAMCLASSRESQEGSMAEMERTRRKKGSKGANHAGFCLIFFLWLLWVLVAACGLPLVAKSRGLLFAVVHRFLIVTWEAEKMGSS